MRPSWLSVSAVAAVAAAFIRAIYFTPIEAKQGAAQKIFYIHAPSAWAGFLAFGLVGLVSAMYLWTRDERLDRFAESSAEVGIVFMTVVLITGPLWARPVWGTYWQWDDARLVVTLFMWLLFLGYMVLRGAVDDAGTRARYSAVLGILGALLVPLNHVSVYLVQRLHPPPMVMTPETIRKPDTHMPPEMLFTLLFSFAAFTFLYIALVRERYRYAVARDRALEERFAISSGGAR
jgi:heme exporter protein C